MAESREDYAAILICTLRVHVKRQIATMDGRGLIYQTPTIRRRLPSNKIDKSAVGLQYKMLGTAHFDLERTLHNSELLIEHSMVIIKRIFDDHPRAIDMPSEMDYAVGVLIRQCLILSLFMLISP
jgi:hypothetical protein